MFVPEHVNMTIQNLYFCGCELEIKFKTNEIESFTQQKFKNLIYTAQERHLPYYVIAQVVSENLTESHRPYNHFYDAVGFVEWEKSTLDTPAYKDPSTRQTILAVHYCAIELFTAKGEKATTYTFQPFLPTLPDKISSGVEALDYGAALEEEGKSEAAEADGEILQAITKRVVNFASSCVDVRERIKWIRAAAAQGLASAQYTLAVHYYKGTGVEKDYCEAVRLWTAAADQELAQAQDALALCYIRGKGIEKDLDKAVSLWKAAAAQRFPKAQHNLALRYHRGEGVKQDFHEAVRLWTDAATQGLADAQHSLALCYIKGEGVKQDFHEAVRLWTDAATQGLADAQHSLALCYIKGEGIEKDLSKAVPLLKAAAAQGNVSSQKALLKISGQVKRPRDEGKAEKKDPESDPEKKGRKA